MNPPSMLERPVDNNSLDLAGLYFNAGEALPRARKFKLYSHATIMATQPTRRWFNPPARFYFQYSSATENNGRVLLATKINNYEFIESLFDLGSLFRDPRTGPNNGSNNGIVDVFGVLVSMLLHYEESSSLVVDLCLAEIIRDHLGVGSAYSHQSGCIGKFITLIYYYSDPAKDIASNSNLDGANVVSFEAQCMHLLARMLGCTAFKHNGVFKEVTADGKHANKHLVKCVYPSRVKEENDAVVGVDRVNMLHVHNMLIATLEKHGDMMPLIDACIMKNTNLVKLVERQLLDKKIVTIFLRLRLD